MGLLLKNNARSTLSVAINENDTAIRVRVGNGERFPLPTKAGDWFPLTLEDASGNIEILRASGRNGDIITVQRGSENTQARTFDAGDVVELRLTAAAVLNADPLDQSVVKVSISDAKLG